MKIAIIGHKRIPSREGGVEVVVEELATRLVKSGNQVDVYNRKGKNVADKNIKILCIKNPEKILVFFVFYSGFYLLITYLVLVLLFLGFTFKFHL